MLHRGDGSADMSLMCKASSPGPGVEVSGALPNSYTAWAPHMQSAAGRLRRLATMAEDVVGDAVRTRSHGFAFHSSDQKS